MANHLKIMLNKNNILGTHDTHPISRCKTADTQWQKNPASCMAALARVLRQLLTDLTIYLVPTTDTTLNTTVLCCQSKTPMSAKHAVCFWRQDLR